MSKIFDIRSSVDNIDVVISDALEATGWSYRERLAGLSLAAILLAYIPYFTYVTVSPPPDGSPEIGRLAVFAVAAGVHAVLQLAGTLWLRSATPPGEARLMDERDRAIAHAARSLAYGVLIAGLCVSGVVMPFQTGGWRIINTSLFAIVVAEVAHHATIVVRYRQQS